ncbi:MAG: bifunctional lysine ketoglutarate reductase /saccharopine dehydrogenase family protein [Euryarchaeota archaeon]|nr:bifunctional lysine ketoglutarate reductase /saccharopine dehydrogenase family protein [Euryarchaeota archaeon]
MKNRIGIRREDKNRWERRTLLTPKHVKKLKENSIDVIIQPSKIRAFSDEDYKKAGATIQDDLSSCNAIFAVKEIPPDLFEYGHTYIFFAHVIKGQKHNMQMLKKMMELKCNLIDYEKITNEKGARLIFFGRWAGLAGMANTLSAYGEKLKKEGMSNPFSEIKHTHQYENLAEVKESILKVGKKIEEEGLPNEIIPMVIGIAGYGNVSRGCQEILDFLPIEEMNPRELVSSKKSYKTNKIYKVIFKEEDTVEPLSGQFDLQDYYDNPENYCCRFYRYLPFLSILMNCIYWDKRYPRLVTKGWMRRLYEDGKKKLKVIGDISCDIDGAIEFTMKATDIDSPVFTYDPIDESISDAGKGVVVMAVDNLPCELPKEASDQFGDTLLDFIPSIAGVDFSKEFDKLNLPSPIKKALILHRGELTPDYKYIEKYL